MLRRTVICRVTTIIVAAAASGALSALIAQVMQSWWCLLAIVPLAIAIGIGAALLGSRVEDTWGVSRGR